MHTAELWRDLTGARFFITGGTGFYGKWLLESIAAANDQLCTHARATILSRDPARFSAEVPHLAARPEFDFLVGDTASFTFPATHFHYVLHFASASAAQVGVGDMAPLLASLAGTERVLKLTRASGAHRLLFASSGAVYGRQPAKLSHIPEDYIGGPDLTQPTSAYGEMKRLSEVMCVSAPETNCVIARGFAFMGPYLPLTDKFAIGSFLRQALAGHPIRLHGDGSPIRSYLYAADLVIWLLTILLRGKPSAAYNVGSDIAISLADLARSAAVAAGDGRIEITQPLSPRENSGRYIPSIEKARHELGLAVHVPLEIGLQRMIEWARQNQ
jgi:nucleoside-diphosphate-sugar epimerase